MKLLHTTLTVLLCTITMNAQAESASTTCARTEGITLQVLGSGGPIADDGRASSGYLVWINGKSRFLVDAGGGVFLRFGESGARFEDLEHIAISHLHTDHSADLVALLKSGYFADRSRQLSISGPSKAGNYPGTADYLKRLLDQDQGAYAYLNGYLDGNDGLIELVPTEVEVLTDDREYYTPISSIQYPAGEPTTVSFWGEPIAMYEGMVSIEGKLGIAAGNTRQDPFQVPTLLRLRLKLQACNDKICLPASY